MPRHFSDAQGWPRVVSGIHRSLGNIMTGTKGQDKTIKVIMSSDEHGHNVHDREHLAGVSGQPVCTPRLSSGCVCRTSVCRPSIYAEWAVIVYHALLAALQNSWSSESLHIVSDWQSRG